MYTHIYAHNNEKYIIYVPNMLYMYYITNTYHALCMFILNIIILGMYMIFTHVINHHIYYIQPNQSV